MKYLLFVYMIIFFQFELFALDNKYRSVYRVLMDKLNIINIKSVNSCEYYFGIYFSECDTCFIEMENDSLKFNGKIKFLCYNKDFCQVYIDNSLDGLDITYFSLKGKPHENRICVIDSLIMQNYFDMLLDIIKSTEKLRPSLY